MLEFGLFTLVMIDVFAISFAAGYYLFRYRINILYSTLGPVSAFIVLMLVGLGLIHGLTFMRILLGAVGVFILFVWGDDRAYKKDAKGNQAKLDSINNAKAELLKNNGKTWN